MRLAGRVAVITECGRGESFGVVWARALAREGAAVLIADSDPARAEAVASELSAVGARAASAGVDVRSEASCRALVTQALARFQRIDLPADTHRRWDGLRGDDSSDTYLAEVLDYNATSILRTARAVLPAMRAQGGGRIISLSSIGAGQTGGRHAEQLARTGELPSLAYPASKILENGLTRLLAGALGQYGITVNAIAPGMVSSPGTMPLLSAAERQDRKSVV